MNTTTNTTRTARNRLPLAIVAGLVVLSGTMLFGGAAEARRGRGADDVTTSTTVLSIPSSSTPSIPASSTPSIPSSAPASMVSRSVASIPSATVTTVDDHGGRGRGRGGRG